MAASKLDEYKEVVPANRKAWRQWLAKHHAKSPGVWLVLEKKGSRNPERLMLDEAVEEALCYGWIDSVPRKRDEASYLLLMTPRKSGSEWSAINKRRVRKLIDARLMTKHGLAKIEAAQHDGSWSKLDASDRLEVPADLHKAFAKHKTARKNFDAFPPGVRKNILAWIHSAKREETRAKRIAETVAKAAENVRANQWRG